jgi:hypothetical protein
MSKVGQISIARPGEPLRLFFDETDLENVIENEANSGDHVTLYPGDYTTISPNIDIEIPQGVGVTILPGAEIEYIGDFRTEDFSHDQGSGDSEPLDSTVNPHPLSDDAQNPTAERYVVPNFTGFVENISDHNFGSEWAFESDVEDLRDTVNSLNTNTFFEFSSPFSNNVVQASFGETIELRNGPDITLDYDRLSSNDGIFIDWSLDADLGVTRVEAGNKLEMKNAQIVDDVEVQHVDISTSGSTQNSGTEYIQSLTVDDGHVTSVTSQPIVEVVDSVPSDSEGEDGDIRLVVIP